MATKPKRYSGEPDFYRKKLNKVMAEFGLKPEHWELKYDRWEGAALDFTYKGVTRRFERIVDKERIFYATDCLAQIALAMERLLWLKREGIFELDVLTAGLPLLMPPNPLPQCFKDLGFDQIPASSAEVIDRYRSLSKSKHPDTGGSNAAFADLQKSRDDCLRHLYSKGITS